MDPRSTFDVTTPGLNVTASPVDPYVAPGDPSGLGQLVTALSTVNPALRSYAQWSQDQFDQGFQEGQLQRAKGEERPTEGQARIKGWEYLNGQLEARRSYRNELTEFVARNVETLTPEEFRQGLQELSSKYMEGGSEDYLKGFVSVALDLEDKALENYTATQETFFRAEGLNRVSQLAEDETSEVIDGALREILGPGVLPQGSPLEDIAGNVVAYTVLENSNFSKEVAEKMREALSATQELAQSLGIGRLEVSELYVDRVGQMAVRLGLPELLSFTQARDRSGVSLEGSTLSSKIHNYREQATASRDRYIEAYDRRMEELRKQNTEMLSKSLWTMIGDAGIVDDPVVAAQMASDIRDVMESEDVIEYLDPATHRTMTNALTSIIERRQQFPQNGNSDAYIELDTMAIFGDLTVEDVLYAASEGYLTESWYRELMGKARSIMEREEAEERRITDELAQFRKTSVRDMMNTIVDYIEGSEQVGLILSHDERAAAKIKLNMATDKWAQEDRGEWDIRDFQDNVIGPVLNDFGLSYAQLLGYRGERDEPEVYSLDPDAVLEAWEREDAEWGNFITRLSRNALRGLGLIQKDLPPEASWTYNGATALDNYSTLLSNGYSVARISQRLRDHGEPEDAIKFYEEFVAIEYANEIYSDPLFAKDTVEGGKFIRELLTRMGFSEEIVEKAVMEGRNLYYENNERR